MSKKLGVFPYTRELCPLIRGGAMLDGYALTHVWAPSFLQYDGADCNDLDGGEKTNQLISSFQEAEMQNCDAIYVHFCGNIEGISVYEQCIQLALQHQKEVLLSRSLALKLTKSVTDKCKIMVNDVTVLDTNILYDIPVPVISVFSQGMYCDTFAVELSLRKHFCEQGYSVVQIGSQDYSALFGFEKQPDFLYGEMDAQKKVLHFNRYIKQLTDKYNPDVVIIGIADRMMKYGNTILDGFEPSA